ncbi:hypothetical protein BA895_21475 [Humibacillus sp. DSM 29435]|uniref:hypothetical protein n=1 Tax=Humibacillus sp. DSM 29435 TaxID=1869167 RepID=UPI000871CBA8|nr:hypothetical protein [Humibacillus sp. DSM 29435]OFE15746.1 hypothetical protein BA895_21475 [Humibacillus sp. DSM 29435]
METDVTPAQGGRAVEPVPTFWERYHRRWLPVAVVCGVLAMGFGATAAQREGWSVVTYALSGGLIGGIFLGSAATLLAAVFPMNRPIKS